MRRFGLKAFTLTAAVLLASTTADAGHRRSCRTCGSAAGSSGGWYHFSSSGGMYVPRSTPAAAVWSSTAWGPSPGHSPGPGGVVWAGATPGPRPCGRCGPR